MTDSICCCLWVLTPAPSVWPGPIRGHGLVQRSAACVWACDVVQRIGHPDDEQVVVG